MTAPTHRTVDLDDVSLHVVEAGSGPPLVLLHGWPQTWYEWRHVIDGLADRFHLIVPDLRGLGGSSIASGGYDKRTIGGDIATLMERLGHERYFVAGHDWGGPVAYALAVRAPERVRKLAILDVTIPGDGADGFSQGGRRWHHAFHRTPDLPEALVEGRVGTYLDWFYRNWSVRSEAIDRDAVAGYVCAYDRPGRMSAGFEYYRALPRDIEDNARALERGKLAMPMLGLGGDGPWARANEVVESLRRVGTDVRGGVVPDCGHFIPEERPDVVIREFRAFFAEG